MKKTSNTKNKGLLIEEHDRMKAAKYISQFLEKKTTSYGVILEALTPTYLNIFAKILTINLF